MKRYIGRILICVLPVLVSIIVVGWAYAKYTKGEGAFRMGVDQSGGTTFVYPLEKQSTDKRAFTGEEVENIKNLIQQQGRLEFRILANRNDDKDAIAAAEEYMKDPKNAERLKDLNVKGEPPPPPSQNGDRYF